MFMNVMYADSVCHLCSYPAILAVPAKITDSSLASLASQFNLSRLPVVTWRHPRKEAVLLRSSSFIPSAIGKKKFSTHGGQSQKPAASSEKLVQNR